VFTLLKQKSVIAYGFIAIMLITAFAFTWVLVDSRKDIAHTIDITSKQRMLIERVLAYSLKYEQSHDHIHQKKLASILHELENNFLLIKEIKSPQVQQILEGGAYDYSRHFKNFTLSVDRMIDMPTRQQSNLILYSSENLLTTSEAIVAVFVREFDDYISEFKLYSILLLTLSLLVVLLVYRKITLTSLDKAQQLFNDLHASEAKIRSITENTHSMIFIKSTEGHYTFANQRFCEFIGQPNEAVIGKLEEDLFDPETAKTLREHDQAVLADKKPITFTEKLMHESVPFYFSTDKFLIYDHAGEILGLCGIATDITKEINLNNAMRKTEYLLKQAQNIAKLGTWRMDTSTMQLELSDTLAPLLGLKSEEHEILLEDFSDLIIKPDELETVLKLFDDAIQFGIPFQTEFHTFIDGHIHALSIYAEVEFNDDTPGMLYGSMQDITTIEKQRKEMRDLINIVDEHIITSKTDLQGNITYVSEAFSQISGFAKDELIGQNHRIVRHPDMPNELFTDMWETIKAGKVWRGDIKNRTKDDGFYWVDVTISPVYDVLGYITGYLAIRQDITARKHVELLSITDGLTGLYNRRHFNDITPREINRAKRENGTLCFILLDIDNFKKYNDTYGHQEGDSVLIKVANSLNESFQRGGDFVFRLGGEEFGVLFNITDPDNILFVVERARAAIEALAITHEKNPAGVVTASFGLIEIPLSEIRDAEKDLETIYKRADDALYEAKTNGRNRICTAKP
jgi:diguanylate cyclase (GGDEF)-like protein/PAS domain S-box-containing protein